MKPSLKPTENYSEFGLYNRRMIEITGEIYNEPIFDNAEIPVYNRAIIKDVETKVQIGEITWGNAPAELPDLKITVKDIRKEAEEGTAKFKKILTVEL